MACVSKYCDWSAKFGHFWKQITLDYRVYGASDRAKVPEWRSSVVETFVHPVHVAQLSDGDLVVAAVSMAQKHAASEAVRYDLEAIKRRYLYWLADLINNMASVVFSIRRLGRLIDAYGSIFAQIEAVESSYRKAIDDIVANLATVTYHHVRAMRSERVRLLNPDYDAIEDAAEKRFALLEIDDEQ